MTEDISGLLFLSNVNKKKNWKKRADYFLQKCDDLSKNIFSVVILKKENIENIEKLCDSKKNESNLKLIMELSLANRKKFSYLKNLKGKIIISHCKGLDTIIFFFDFRGFYNNHIRLLSENF